jgi:hypothetical protein
MNGNPSAIITIDGEFNVLRNDTLIDGLSWPGGKGIPASHYKDCEFMFHCNIRSVDNLAYFIMFGNGFTHKCRTI